MFGLFEEHTFDAVAHVAAMAGVRNSVANPALYLDVNLVGTQGLMDAARAFGVQNFVFASTSSVYGDTETIPFVETDPCLHPPQPYGPPNCWGIPTTSSTACRSPRRAFLPSTARAVGPT